MKKQRNSSISNEIEKLIQKIEKLTQKLEAYDDDLRKSLGITKEEDDMIDAVIGSVLIGVFIGIVLIVIKNNLIG